MHNSSHMTLHSIYLFWPAVDVPGPIYSQTVTQLDNTHVNWIDVQL